MTQSRLIRLNVLRCFTRLARSRHRSFLFKLEMCISTVRLDSESLLAMCLAVLLPLIKCEAISHSLWVKVTGMPVESKQ